MREKLLRCTWKYNLSKFCPNPQPNTCQKPEAQAIIIDRIGFELPGSSKPRYYTIQNILQFSLFGILKKIYRINNAKGKIKLIEKNRKNLLYLLLSGGLLVGLSLAVMGNMNKTPSSPTEVVKPSIPLIDQEASHQFKTATFALGWFWGPDSQFGSMKGVIRTRVGYAGGEKSNPTYTNLGNHAETIQMDYDPEQISYAELLDIFWQNHDTSSRDRSSQYRAILFYHDDEQRKLAEESKAALETALGKTITTEILPYQNLTWAEDYHQKYQLRNSRLAAEYLQIYPNPIDFVNSSATTRVNAYLAGYGTADMLAEEIDRLGLSSAGKDYLQKAVSR